MCQKLNGSTYMYDNFWPRLLLGGLGPGPGVHKVLKLNLSRYNSNVFGGSQGMHNKVQTQRSGYN